MRLLLGCVIFLACHTAIAVDAPTVVKRDQPTVIEHEAGEKINAIFALIQDGSVTWQFLPDSHFIRTEEKTYLAAPPGEYVIVVGESQILKVIEEGTPSPRPNPKPNPKPEPDPNPDPQPDPNPGGIRAEWVIWIEELQDRTKNIKQTSTMQSLELRQTLESIGLKVRTYDKDLPEAAGFRDLIKIPLPALIILGKDPKEFRVFAAPTSTEDAEKLIRGAIVR